MGWVEQNVRNRRTRRALTKPPQVHRNARFGAARFALSRKYLPDPFSRCSFFGVPVRGTSRSPESRGRVRERVPAEGLFGESRFSRRPFQREISRARSRGKSRDRTRFGENRGPEQGPVRNVGTRLYARVRAPVPARTACAFTQQLRVQQNPLRVQHMRDAVYVATATNTSAFRTGCACNGVRSRRDPCHSAGVGPGFT